MWYFICEKGKEKNYRHYEPFERFGLDDLPIMKTIFRSELEFQYACIKDETVRKFVLGCDNKTGKGETTYLLATRNTEKAHRIFDIVRNNLKEQSHTYILAYIKDGHIISNKYNIPVEANHDFTILRKLKVNTICITSDIVYGCDNLKTYGFDFERTMNSNGPDYVDKQTGITITVDLHENGYYDQDVMEITICSKYGETLKAFCQFNFIKLG